MAGQSKFVEVLGLASFAQFNAINLVNQATTAMVKQHFGESQTETVHALSKISAITAVIEFLVNPLVGKLSDAYGRKPFLLAAPVLTAIFHQLIARNPSLRNLVVGRIIVDVAVAVFVTAMTASIADRFKDDETKLAGVSGMLDVAAGFSIVVGAFVGSRLSNNPRKTYHISSLVALAAAVVIAVGYKEQKREQEKSSGEKKGLSISISDLNPLSFLWLFQKSPLMAKLNLVNALQQVPMFDASVQEMYAEKVRGWSPAEMGKYEAFLGIGDMIAGAFIGGAIKHFGPRDHATFSNASSLVAQVISGIATSNNRAFLAVFFYIFGSMRFSVLDSRISAVGNDLNVGQGKLAADRANLSAVIKTLAPLMYSRVFAKACALAENAKSDSERKLLLGLPYFVNAGLLGVAQMLLLTLSKRDWEHSHSE